MVLVQQIFIHIFNFIVAEHRKFLQNPSLKSVRILMTKRTAAIQMQLRRFTMKELLSILKL